MITVLGAGVAGLSAVLWLASNNVPVTLVTAGRFGQDATAAGNTALAQGGLAAALDRNDSPALHAADTITAGAGLVDPKTASLLAVDGAQRVQELLTTGFPADRHPDGELAFGLEAAHSRARVVHAGEDSSGAALSAFLTASVQNWIETGAVRLIDHATVQDLLLSHGRVTGLVLQQAGRRRRLSASAVVLATGGFAGLYPTTSSSSAVTGQGLLVAARAGAVVADLEFVQFHPTVLPATGQLISEAVRGAGAVLRDPNGQRFMLDVHSAAELAPRDVVSRASVEVMQRFDASHVWLDATVIETAHGAGTLATRFPVLTAALAAQGIDWTTQYVPVAPAAHYCMGGVATDTHGRSSIPGLFAAGEVASTGVHGANRLASNSLLEGLVFGTRAAQAASAYHHNQVWALEPAFEHFIQTASEVPTTVTPLDASTRQHAELQQLVHQHLGMTRDAIGLRTVLHRLDDVEHPMSDLVRLIATAAVHRTESRGGHWRTDYPHPVASQAHRRAWTLTTMPHHIPAEDQRHRKETIQHVDA